MSGENTDLDATNRSRSLLRQVRDTIGGINRSRNRLDTTTGSPPLRLTLPKRQSLDNIDTKPLQTKIHPKKSTPIAFSHHLSLLNQVKSHINKTRKYHPNIPSPGEFDDSKYLSLPPTISISVS